MAVGCVLLTGASAGSAAAAQAPVGLGTAASFAILAGSAVTNTGPSTINGDLGVTPSATVTGFPPATVNGTVHAADAVAAQAQADLTVAYDDAAGRLPPEAVPADLGGMTLTPGVYRAAAGLGLTGALTLDALGDPDAVFVLQAPSTLITASDSRMTLINGAQPCNVFWQVGSSATLGTSSQFSGNILADTSISMNDSVVLAGRALARNGAVTLINDTITAPHCTTPTAGTSTTGPTTAPAGGAAPAPTGTPAGTTTADSITARGKTGAGPSAGNAAAGAGTARLSPVVPAIAMLVRQRGLTTCIRRGFAVAVTGRFIRRVTFTVGGKRVATRTHSPFQAIITQPGGMRTVRAHVLFSDGTAARTLSWRYRSCLAAAGTAQRRVGSPSRRPTGNGGFTG